MTEKTLEQRVDRIESQLAIGQLPPRYALAVDSRDLDSLVNLFVPDVRCGRRGNGRAALKDFYDTVLRDFYRSHHQVCGHVINFDAEDLNVATGTTYCRAEHEDGDQWVVMAICYFDRYRRVDNEWFFESRDERHWYASDELKRPGEPQFQNWNKFTADRFQPRLPNTFDTWADFWSRSSDEAVAELTRHR